VSMSVTVPQDRDKAKDVCLHAEGLTISLDQTLRRQFGRSIKRSLHRERAIFGSGNNGCFAVNRTSRREDDSLYTGAPHRLEYIPGSDGILIEIATGMIGPEADIGIGGQVKDHIGAGGRLFHSREVQQVSANQPETRGGERIRQEGLLSSRKIVESYDNMALLQQSVSEIAANKPGGAGDQSFHRDDDSLWQVAPEHHEAVMGPTLCLSLVESAS
jgi:hypothetical protein